MYAWTAPARPGPWRSSPSTRTAAHSGVGTGWAPEARPFREKEHTRSMDRYRVYWLRYLCYFVQAYGLGREAAHAEEAGFLVVWARVRRTRPARRS